ncbi:isochorismatase family protein [Roseinatronobacter sp. S2]|uniref:isochorismatase family protein n=1 Tax=Roseinatronobacter sp. S2 TaxID=3035471 RepID=UPI0024107A14|nr:isochorismatase family protein [Roseinatronobacter sp. S2]WFE73652.1 isochorismatase family protein [Roseinatronobacter sp. S2]
MKQDYGWGKFLSERDQQHDKLWGKTEPSGFGEKPALLLIDMYYSVVGLERQPIFESMKTWPGSMGLEGWAAIDMTVPLLEAAREYGIPVIHIKGLQSGIKPWIHRKRGPSKLSAEMQQRGSEIVDELKPVAGEVVIEKTAPSAFQGTPLAFHLTALGIDTLICCGESTSGCVRASVVDGATHRYRMGVVSECVYDRTEASHFMNLYDMHQKYADVVTRDMAIDYLRSTVSDTSSEPIRKSA